MRTNNENNKTNEQTTVGSSIFRLKLGQCEDINEFNAARNEITQYTVNWKTIFPDIKRKLDFGNAQAASNLGISEATFGRASRSIPKRDIVIRICAMYGLSLDETNDILTKKAGYTKLYSKNPIELIWIYIIRNRKAFGNNPQNVFNEYYAIFEKYYADADIDTKNVDEPRDTQFYDSHLNDCEIDEDYLNLYADLKSNITLGYKNLHNEICKDIKATGETANSLFGNNDRFLNRHYRAGDDFDNSICPSRAYIIFLGIKLRYTTDRINDLLECGGMAPLSVYDTVERAIFYRLEKLNVEYPAAFAWVHKKDDSTHNDVPDAFEDIIIDVRNFILDEMGISEKDEMLSKGVIKFLRDELDVDQLFDENLIKEASEQ